MTVKLIVYSRFFTNAENAVKISLIFCEILIRE